MYSSPRAAISTAVQNVAIGPSLPRRQTNVAAAFGGKAATPWLDRAAVIDPKRDFTTIKIALRKTRWPLLLGA
jgi:hypothetical protein